MSWRSRAHAYYWSKMLPTLAAELFHDEHLRAVHLNLVEVHLRMKWELAPWGDDPEADIQSQVRSTSTSGMSNKEFGDYLNRLTIFAAKRGIEFPQRIEFIPEEFDGEKPV